MSRNDEEAWGAYGDPPLTGLRVLDLSRLLPGGYCTLVLADLGADVIKVEEPGRGDTLRAWPPPASNGISGPYLALNRGKRSLTCNLKNPDGREVLRDLVRSADVLVESFRAGVMDRLGTGYLFASRHKNGRLSRLREAVQVGHVIRMGVGQENQFDR